MAGMVTLIILILGTMIGPLIYTTPINGIDFGRAIQGPSVAHPFGTDDLGRDMLARVLWGGRVSIAVGITAVLLAITLGTGVGATDTRIITKHILPNVLSSVLVAATLGVGGAIILESTLSFLGLGFPSDVPTWGRLLFDAQNYLDLAPHLALFPGLAIFLTVLSVNYIGDGLRDALDPRKGG